jgi:hypothetical protein
MAFHSTMGRAVAPCQTPAGAMNTCNWTGHPARQDVMADPIMDVTHFDDIFCLAAS